MSKAIVTESKLTAIADAVRDRFGVTGQKTLDELAEIIEAHLPKGLQQVDYIEASGTQYINTNRFGINGLKMKMEIVGSPQNNEGYFGAITDNKHNRYDMIYYDGLYFCCGTSNNDDDILADISAYASAQMIIEQGVTNQNLVVNGDTVKTFNSFTNTSSYPIYLFWRATESTYGMLKGKARIYYCELYSDGDIVCQFIPCYRKSDKVIGLYDIINGQFYTNAGSGTFTCYPAPPA